VLLQEETRNLLVLGETHPELLRHPRRHLRGLGVRGELEVEGGLQDLGLGLGVSM
jgi:hypothetical protein